MGDFDFLKVPFGPGQCEFPAVGPDCADDFSSEMIVPMEVLQGIGGAFYVALSLYVAAQLAPVYTSYKADQKRVLSRGGMRVNKHGLRLLAIVMILLGSMLVGMSCITGYLIKYKINTPLGAASFVGCYGGLATTSIAAIAVTLTLRRIVLNELSNQDRSGSIGELKLALLLALPTTLAYVTLIVLIHVLDTRDNIEIIRMATSVICISYIVLIGANVVLGNTVAARVSQGIQIAQDTGNEIFAARLISLRSDIVALVNTNRVHVIIFATIISLMLFPLIHLPNVAMLYMLSFLLGMMPLSIIVSFRFFLFKKHRPFRGRTHSISSASSSKLLSWRSKSKMSA
mmetsp:Transcript_7753/g.14232  ORF Transcript_7753/g.14232 Transcript_7753/m.14232 type:complete len:343 (+) Transcript_7753:42-1070(+)